MSDQYQQQEVQEDVNQGQGDDGSAGKPVESSDDYSDGFNSIDDAGGDSQQQPQQQEASEEIKDDVSEPEKKEPVQQPEEDETQKDNYKSLLGRHQRLQDEVRQLREQRQQPPPQQTQPVFEKAEIPEDLKDDVEAFKKQYPEYSALIEVKGREGDRLRGILSEYGANLAAVQAENLVTRIELARSKQEVSYQVNQQAAISHEQQIYTAHPDFASMDVSGKREFLESVREWIEDLPMKEARKWDAVYHRGNTGETIQLFNEFKKYHTTTQNNSKQQTKRQQAIEDGLAVKAGARQVSHLRRTTDKNDFVGGWASIPD